MSRLREKAEQTTCPACGAGPGELCKFAFTPPWGHEMYETFHSARYAAAKTREPEYHSDQPHNG